MQTDPRTIQALIDNDQGLLTRIADEKRRALKAAMGDECPECGSKNCAADDERGGCDDCGATWHTSS